MLGKKILIMGLPDSGKTTLAEWLCPMLNAVWFNADEIRNEINKDLKFTVEDRIEQARRMGVLCSIVIRSGHNVVADFVCPTPETRQAFNADFIVWMDRVKEGRFEDTNKLFIPPVNYDIRIPAEGAPSFWAKKIQKMLTNSDY